MSISKSAICSTAGILKRQGLQIQVFSYWDARLQPGIILVLDGISWISATLDNLSKKLQFSVDSMGSALKQMGLVFRDFLWKNDPLEQHNPMSSHGRPPRHRKKPV